MNAPVRCTGLVVDRDGRPVPHALIMILDGPVPVPEIALVADDEGRFAFTLAPGRWRVQARGERGVGETEVIVRPQETRIEIVVG